MAAPVVQNLADIIASLNSVYDPQRQAVQGQIDTTNSNEAQQEAGVNAQKDTAFQGITNQANAHGVLFSGFTPDAQAKYTAGTYLPTLVKLHQAANDNVAKLQQNIVSLNSAQQSDAQKTQQGQVSDLNAYNLEQQKEEQAAALAQLQAQTKLQAASISASGRGSSGPNAAAIKQQDLGTIAQTLQSKVGKDGHVSQETWNAAQNAWTAAGYSAGDFNKNFTQYVNQRYKGYHGFN